jgi:hypothetical protein
MMKPYSGRAIRYTTNSAGVTQDQLYTYVQAAAAKERAVTNAGTMRDNFANDLTAFFRNGDFAIFSTFNGANHVVRYADPSKCIASNATTAAGITVAVVVASLAGQEAAARASLRGMARSQWFY